MCMVCITAAPTNKSEIALKSLKNPLHNNCCIVTTRRYVQVVCWHDPELCRELYVIATEVSIAAHQ